MSLAVERRAPLTTLNTKSRPRAVGFWRPRTDDLSMLYLEAGERVETLFSEAMRFQNQDGAVKSRYSSDERENGKQEKLWMMRSFVSRCRCMCRRERVEHGRENKRGRFR